MLLVVVVGGGREGEDIDENVGMAIVPYGLNGHQECNQKANQYADRLDRECLLISPTTNPIKERSFPHCLLVINTTIVELTMMAIDVKG